MRIPASVNQNLMRPLRQEKKKKEEKIHLKMRYQPSETIFNTHLKYDIRCVVYHVKKTPPFFHKHLPSTEKTNER